MASTLDRLPGRNKIWTFRRLKYITEVSFNGQYEQDAVLQRKICYFHIYGEYLNKPLNPMFSRFGCVFSNQLNIIFLIGGCCCNDHSMTRNLLNVHM